MSEKLFDYLIDTYKSDLFGRNITLPKYSSATFEGKIDVLPKDIEAIIKAMHFNVSLDAYKLFKAYVNHENVVYSKENVELIKNDMGLMSYALSDANIPDSVKNEFEAFVRNKRLTRQIDDAKYDIVKKRYDYGEQAYEKFYAPFELKTDEKTKELISEFRSKIAKGTIQYTEFIEALELSPHVDDKEFKKELLEFLDKHYMLNERLALTLRDALAHEQDAEILEHMFEKYLRILCSSYSFDSDYRNSIIYAIYNHPLINEKIADTIAQEMNWSCYTNNKASAKMGCIVAKFGKFKTEDYEILCDVRQYSYYRCETNQRTIVESILQSPNTPLKYLRQLSRSSDRNTRLWANIAIRIKGMTTPNEYENIMTNIMAQRYYKTEQLREDIKKTIYEAIMEEYRAVKRTKRPYEFKNPLIEYKPLLAVLRQNNELMPEFNQFHLSYLAEIIGNFDKYEKLYLIEKELEQSKEYRYVMIERGLFAAIEEKDLADDILSDETDKSGKDPQNHMNKPTIHEEINDR